MLTVYEPGFYTLLIRSNKPEAKPFRRWVTHEVLPAIRKTGFYSAGENPQNKAEKVKSLSHIAEDDAALEKMFRKRKKLLMELGFDKTEAVFKAVESIRKIVGIDLSERFGFEVDELRCRVSKTSKGLHKNTSVSDSPVTSEKSDIDTDIIPKPEAPKNYRGWNLNTRGKNKKGEVIFNLAKKIGGKKRQKYLGVWNQEKADRIIDEMNQKHGSDSNEP